MLNPGPLEG